jgi:hypothetical protein
MFSSLQVYDAKCEDAGVYYCKVSYLDGNFEYTAVAQKNVTAICEYAIFSVKFDFYHHNVAYPFRNLTPMTDTLHTFYFA